MFIVLKISIFQIAIFDFFLCLSSSNDCKHNICASYVIFQLVALLIAPVMYKNVQMSMIGPGYVRWILRLFMLVGKQSD